MYEVILETLTQSQIPVQEYDIALVNCNTEIGKAANGTPIIHALNKLLDSGFYPNKYIFNKIIQKLGAFEQIDFTYRFYQLACARNIANETTHTCMITAAGANERIDIAILAYDNSRIGEINVSADNSMIAAAGINHDIALAEKAYRNAISHNIANTATYNNMIVAAGKNNNLDLVMEAYANARIRSLDNAATYVEAMTAACAAEHIGFAEPIIMHAYTTERFEKPKHYTNLFNKLIKLAAKMNLYPLAERTYYMAVNKERTDITTHTTMIPIIAPNKKGPLLQILCNRVLECEDIDASHFAIMITALGMNKLMEDAYHIYNTAASKNLLSEEVHTSLIKVTMLNTQPRYARIAYDRALILGQTNMTTHCQMIYTMAKHEEMALAKIAYENALAMSAGDAAMAHKVMIDSLYLNRFTQDAYRLYEETQTALTFNSENCINLKYQTYATAFIGLEKLISKTSTAIDLKLITGKLRQSNIRENAIHQVKQAVIDLCKKLSLTKFLHDDPNNAEVMTLRQTVLSPNTRPPIIVESKPTAADGLRFFDVPARRELTPVAENEREHLYQFYQYKYGKLISLT